MKVLMIGILCGLLVWLGFPAPKKAQENASEDILQRKVPGNELEFHRTTDVFHSSLGRTRLPGGMVRIVDCEPDTLMQSWKPLDSPLRQVLDTLVATDPRYRWQMQDGVVNLLPVKGEPPLLQTHLHEYEVEDLSSALEALDRLLALPEVRKRMVDLRLKQGLTLVKSLSSPNPAKFSVKQSGGTLRQALNAIALAQGRAIWEYVEIHCDGRDQVVIRF